MPERSGRDATGPRRSGVPSGGTDRDERAQALVFGVLVEPELPGLPELPELP
jgi:hypothetical protein